MKRGKTYISIFTKSVIAFLVLGFLPFMLISLAVFSRNIQSVAKSAIDNSYKTTRGIRDDIQELLEDIGEYSKYLYEYESNDYGYFYEILTDAGISDVLRENLVEDALKQILYRNGDIRQVYFIDRQGRIYSSTKAPEKIVISRFMEAWGRENFKPEKNAVSFIPSHKPFYYMNAGQECFTYARNIMDTRSIQSADTEILGTLYIDVASECFRRIIDDGEVAGDNGVMVADLLDGALIYSTFSLDDLPADMDRLAKLAGDSQRFCLKGKEMYYIGYGLEDAPWSVVEFLPFSNLERIYYSVIRNSVWIVLTSMILLYVLYVFYSNTTGKPLRLLKQAMDEIKAGNLETRVDIQSNDELGVLGDGLNGMAEQLQKHIEKVYVSEIRQKEAQLNALAAQIQPHYLYNTLDSIRMSAITNDDQDTALMLESLSAQMRYLSSDNRSLVSLKEELDNLQDYFNIIRIRYENAVQLEMNVGDDTLMCRMPRLTLQPLVENSVKHGIAPKGEGLVAVYAERKQDSLEVMVIDDGVGMDGKALEEINGVLDGKPARQGKWEKSTGIGLKNIEERIKLQFGEGYGLCLSSKEGLGTVVRCRLPIYDQEGEAE